MLKIYLFIFAKNCLKFIGSFFSKEIYWVWFFKCKSAYNLGLGWGEKKSWLFLSFKKRGYNTQDSPLGLQIIFKTMGFKEVNGPLSKRNKGK
jgi:hypothetical protein